jgi:C4-dicarboxylate-specific signal transduction histidine kinase
MLGLMSLIFLAGTFVMLGFSLGWARSIFRPVERMNRVIRQVEQGESAARVGPIRGHDEIGRLAGQFDQLLDKVEENRALLQRSAQELELKVAARTGELADANRTLRDAQKQLVQSEKLAAIGQLTAAIAHEINNPVAVMQGNLDLLRSLLGDHQGLVEAELKLLDKQVERMRTMVADLLRFARPSEYAGEVEALDLGQVLDESLALSSHLLAAGKVRVLREYAATRRVSFSRHALQQLFVNLISNAVQAMPEGGRLTLRTRDCGDAPPRALVEVQDTGPGVPVAIRDQLFEPMFTTRRDGHGLGLWISEALVQRHGGAIEAENVAEGGAVFRVRLNCAAP